MPDGVTAIMKKLIAIFAASLALLVGGAQASSSNFPLDKAPGNTSDMASLQRGAGIFVNYCLSCHSAAFMRWNRLQDIGLTEKQIKDNLLHVSEEDKGRVYGETMKATIDPKQAKAWFGANPPDLTVIARSRASGNGSGADYLYTYMRTFYRDDTRPTGWNNMVFPNVGMPHVLWQLQGERKPIYATPTDEHGGATEGDAAHHVFSGKWEQVTPGTLSPAEYDRAAGDLVNYLQWMAEPAQNKRVRIGVWVLLFLGVFSLITWRLNAAFWQEVK